MTTDIKQLISDFNDETNAVGARIDKLTAKLLNTETVSGEDIANLQAISARLKVIGSDPETPIPAPTTAPTGTTPTTV